MSELVFRDASEGDLAYILSTFSRGIRQHNTGLSKSDLLCAFRSVLGRWSTRVCCVATEPSEILGWATTTTGKAGELVVAWVYVREPFRRKGIARKLLGDERIMTSVFRAPSWCYSRAVITERPLSMFTNYR